ncbi:MAG: PIN domain-containing protein [Candidatus Jacksonbacteria bacterium]
MFLVDTNILIYAALDIEPVGFLFQKWVERKQLSLSVIPVSEFLAGIKSKEELAIEPLIAQLDVWPIDLKIARIAAEYRRQFAVKSKPPYLLDCFLAATAKLHNLILVTHNTADFPMKDIKIIDPMRIKR